MANAADRRQVQLADQQVERRELERRADLKTLLGMHEGRRVFQWILLHLQPRSEKLWSPNAAVTGANAWQYDIGNWLKDRIEEIDPDAVLLMLQESRARDKQDELERQALAAGRKSIRRESDNENESDSPEE